MGTATGCTCVKALSGISPPVGKAVEDAMAPPPIALVARPELAELAPDVAAALVLVGPCATPVVAEPPATRPAADNAIPVRINRLRKSMGFCRNEGFTSSTTW